MTTIGIRELKEQTGKVLRLVREQGETIEITYRGKPVARLVPTAMPKPDKREVAAIWREIDELAAELATRLPKEISAVDAVREQRRDDLCDDL